MPSHKKNETTELRIIGGTLRGRKLIVPVCVGLRPTHDRVRETLFNWLQSVVTDCCCLDAFAGSGALGFEAIARGASSCFFVESGREQARALEKNAQRFEVSDQVQVRHGAWPALKLPPKKFDLVFLDPPFNSGLIDVVWNELLTQGYLAKECYVYIEHSVNEEPVIPAGFSCYKNKRTKQVVYALYKHSYMHS